MHISLRHISEADFDFIDQVTKAAMQTYVELTWGNWVNEEQRSPTYDSIDLSTHQIIQFDSQDVGCLAVERHSSYVQLTKLYLLPNFQRRGIGTFVIRQLIAEAKERKTPLRLRVLAVNPAHRLYQREGFVVQAQTQERIYMEYVG
ncbi:MAG: GNAT family N-acetyltransferase [Nostoc sp.]|uniref:GNAT family N-acetyltransferase n=1 Tax=Nostoc sp. TaxID=1180 RepID=UPI002FF744EB